MKAYVATARSYLPDNMYPNGKANQMLIVQYNFPISYDHKKDRLETDDLISIRNSDFMHVGRIFFNSNFKYLNERNLNKYLISADSQEILVFITNLMKKKEYTWNGFRVLGTANNNNPNYTFQLFWKNPESKTKTYSGNENTF